MPTGDPPMWWDRGCQCPTAWWGICPPPCPVHNPQPHTIVRTTTTLGIPAMSCTAVGAWECPRCLRVNAPSARHCDCQPEVIP